MMFDREARMVSVAQRELPQHYPRAGWVEHDAEDIWRDTVAVLKEAIAASDVALDRIAALGLTNQRERSSSGTARRANRSTAPSSGRIAGLRTFAPRSRPKGRKTRFKPKPAFCSTLISQPRS
jgi:hypothetical protein